jgi:hypothetical protein
VVRKKNQRDKEGDEEKWARWRGEKRGETGGLKGSDEKLSTNSKL